MLWRRGGGIVAATLHQDDGAAPHGYVLFSLLSLGRGGGGYKTVHLEWAYPPPPLPRAPPPPAPA
jgi:hypothetical protein